MEGTRACHPGRAGLVLTGQKNDEDGMAVRDDDASDKAAHDDTTGDKTRDKTRDKAAREALGEAMRDQKQRQERLRHAQAFLTSPLFLDLREQPFTVSDPPEAIEERKRDVDYRITVLTSLVELLREERKLLDRTGSAMIAGKAGENGGAEGVDTAAPQDDRPQA